MKVLWFKSKDDGTSLSSQTNKMADLNGYITGNINTEVEGKQNSLFPAGPAIRRFAIPSQLKVNSKLAGLPGARPDHVRVESSSCCFTGEFVSFIRPRQIVRVRFFGMIRVRISDPRSVWIMGHQRNRRIHSGHGFAGSFDTP